MALEASGAPIMLASVRRLRDRHLLYACTRVLVNRAGLDPVGGLDLRATLQECIARAAAAHGASFGAAMQVLDPDLMAQVQAAFGS